MQERGQCVGSFWPTGTAFRARVGRRAMWWYRTAGTVRWASPDRQGAGAEAEPGAGSAVGGREGRHPPAAPPIRVRRIAPWGVLLPRVVRGVRRHAHCVPTGHCVRLTRGTRGFVPLALRWGRGTALQSALCCNRRCITTDGPCVGTRASCMSLTLKPLPRRPAHQPLTLAGTRQRRGERGGGARVQASLGQAKGKDLKGSGAGTGDESE